jgi:hypothetical protein
VGEVPQVFISYSWDSDEHLKRVLDLSNRLRADGIDCDIDQYQESPPEGWPRWMDRKIRESQFVINVCTEIYLRRLNGEEVEGKGLGVRWEGNLVYQHIYNAGTNNSRFIPVLFEQGDQKFIPTLLQGVTHYLLDSDSGYKRLYNRLFGISMTEKPHLGKVLALQPKEVKMDLALYMHFPINVELWDQARWKGTVFGTAEKAPPFMGILFKNEQAGQEIFREWIQRYGRRDEFEELRVAIIEGDIKGEEPGYSIHIGQDMDNTFERYRHAGLTVNKESYVVSMSRIHRMNPEPTSTHLARFKEAFRAFNSYSLLPFGIAKDGTLQPFFEMSIEKSQIHFRRSEDIRQDDVDSVIFRNDSAIKS